MTKTRIIIVAVFLLGPFATMPAPPAHAFGGNAGPQPGCTVRDFDPPTNVRTQPNGVIINKINNGDRVKIIDQQRATMNGRWPAGGLWDYVEVWEEAEGGMQWIKEGWVYDELIRCN
jgi:hypothetical protein